MKRNFDYIKELGLEDLHRFCSIAEEQQFCNPEVSAVNSRKALEYVVRAVYFLKDLEIGERTSLFEMVDGVAFKDFVGDEKVMMSIHYVRKVGNNAAHLGNVTKKEAFFSLINIYNIISAILIKLKIVESIKPFDETLIPKVPQQPAIAPIEKPNINSSSKIIELADKEAVKSFEAIECLPLDISEAETRKLYIDLMLKDAGWQVLEAKGAIEPSKACIEVEVKGMPKGNGVGYADYVLFGSNGLPLAVIEAKRTAVDAHSGKTQAELYADCLEKRYGRRPVVYYTNGFQTYVLDGLGYTERRLYAFHSQEDLENLILKRGRKDISDLYIKDEITNRAYQKGAIKSVCEHFNKKHRKALLVMATGTGKTRVAISLVDVLKRNDWVKNVLFLADRTSLVSQAHKNFIKHLPNETTSVLNESVEKDLNARITFSTYQTMINLIDTDDKAFSVGRFDLIIVDEAHRSIFGKYGAIFNYFDAMLVGLTATPRDEVDKSTYDMFEMEQGVPNFSYELNQAVDEGFLVNYEAWDRASDIVKNGIKYDDLSDAEKEQMEIIWEYEATRNALDGKPVSRDIESSEIFTYIHNIETIDAVLQDLMQNGLNVQSEELIGKTIIFAYGHKHAQLIVERFKVLYPEYGDDFCVLIDYSEKYAQTLIEKFEIRDSKPQIAVSVDMLDTGIDVPDILNLVFFKSVKSKIKFWQMIGRGTRLSEGIFGNRDKDKFYIFDWCGVFEYFRLNPNGATSRDVKSLTERLFCMRTDIAFHLQAHQYQEDEFAKKLHDDIKAILKGQVDLLSDNHITVRAKWEEVSHFKRDSAWVYLSELDRLRLKKDISPILTKSLQDDNAKKFDLLILAIELSLLDDSVSAIKAIGNVQFIAERLFEKTAIPQIKARIETIKEVLSQECWQNLSLPWLEKIREELRDLTKFLLEGKGQNFVIDIEDIITIGGQIPKLNMPLSYKQRVMDFLAENRDLPVLNKIYEMEQLTDEDIKELQRILQEELGDENEYKKYAEERKCEGNEAVFIRSIIGVNRKEAVERLGRFISNVQLNADQEDFLNSIITYVCVNGDITKKFVANEDPFQDRLIVFTPYVPLLAEYIDNIHNVVIPLENTGS